MKKEDSKIKKNKKETLEDTQTKLKKINTITNNIDNQIINEKPIQKEEKEGSKKESIINIKISEYVVSVLLIVILSILIGYKIGRKDTKEIVIDEKLNKFINVYNNIKDNYYEDINDDELITSAINGMLSGLDDYSFFFDQSSATTFNTKLNGEYEGLGIEILSYNNKTIVYNVFENSPAEKVGIKIGDEIIKIDDISMEGKNATDLSQYVKEKKSEKYNIEIKRNEEVLKFELSRTKVIINTIEKKVIEKDNKKIGYIYIGVFSNAAYTQFKNALEELENEKIDSLIIDVRDNTGGHLSTASSILSLFLDSDKVIYQIEKKYSVTKYYSNGNKTKEYPIVVLQNSSSASASELLSITLKEQLGAKVIGEKSYGKGTVQELNVMNDGTEYKMTTKKWLSPKGNWVNKIGVEPDISVELDENYYNNPLDETDLQLQKALEILK